MSIGCYAPSHIKRRRVPRAALCYFREAVSGLKLTDKQRKQILAEYVEGGTSLRKLATKYGVSTYLIQRILNGDKELSQKIARKKAENVESVLAYMDTKKNDVCGLIDKLLAAMDDPDKIAATSLNQLAVTSGILIDKFTANEAPSVSNGKENNLFDAINACGKEGLDDLPEIQQAAENDAAVVENTEPKE